MSETKASTRSIVFNKEGKILALFRTETAPAYPEHWDLPGGQLEYGEDLYESARREVREETGLEVLDLEVFDAHSANYTDGFWITVIFRGNSETDQVQLSFEHGAHKWVTPEEFIELKSIPNQKDFVKRLFEERA